jgi:glycolate oxidase FAD binding subunit
MRFGALQAALAQNGQMLALDVEHPERATIGGVIAANDSGALRVRYGGVRDQIIGITIVRPDGVTAHGGGRVVKNVAGYDLPKLFTGSLGSLGIITQATFRLYPLPAETRMLAMEVDSTEMARRLLLEMLHSTLMPTGLWVHRDVLGSVTVTAQFSGIPESVESQLQTAESILLGQRGFRPSPAVNSPPRQLEAPGTGGTPFVPGVVLKISVLPTEIPTAIARAIEIGDSNGWETDTLIHAHGLGRITWNTAGNEVGLVEAVESFRAALAPCGGSAVVLQAPLSVKRRLDVWGPATDALPLMRRVKAELDPRSTLNADRMIGGL